MGRSIPSGKDVETAVDGTRDVVDIPEAAMPKLSVRCIVLVTVVYMFVMDGEMRKVRSVNVCVLVPLLDVLC